MIENRKKGLKMHRVWVQSKFRKTKDVDIILAKPEKEFEINKFFAENQNTAEELLQ
jgi:hypothetical protein